jgi:hypothetical protein
MSQMQSQPRRDPLWPAAVIVFGLSVTASWTILLAYGLGRVVEYAISYAI